MGLSYVVPVVPRFEQRKAEHCPGYRSQAAIPAFVFPLVIFHPKASAITKDDKPKQVPLMLEWGEALRRIKWTGYDLEDILTKLSNDDIVWQPYNSIELSTLHKEHVHLGRSRTNLICLDWVYYHSPERAPKQFGIYALDESALQGRPLVPKAVGGNVGTNGCPMIEYAFLVEWKDREKKLIKSRTGHGSGPSTGEPVVLGVDELNYGKFFI